MQLLDFPNGKIEKLIEGTRFEQQSTEYRSVATNFRSSQISSPLQSLIPHESVHAN
jgi:hypothetical protein